MKNFIKDIILFAALVCVYAAGRLSLLALFSDGQSSPSPIWYFTGLRFDIMTAAYLIIPTAALTFVSFFIGRSFSRLKLFYAVAILVLSIILNVVNVCYFSEYHSQFNYWFFGILFDDIYLIACTIWKDYPLVWIFFGVIALAYALFRIFKFAYAKVDLLDFSKHSFFVKVLGSVGYAVLLLFLMRGANLWGRPLQYRDAAVEPSEFLNGLVPSCAYCLNAELDRFIKSVKADGLSHFKINESEIGKITKEIFGNGEDLNRALTRKAKGSLLKTKPRRIFFILGEGHSAWPTYDEFSSFNLMPQTKALYANSLYCKTAFAGGGGTMASASSFISGLPYYGLDIRGISNNFTDCASAKIFKRLGYSSTFFYAGQSTWMRLSEYLHHNGFEKVVGGESMGDLYGSVEWGLRDGDMFDFILKQDIPENSFNMILTVSNHPPYDVDLKAEGCTASLKTDSDVRLYHMWYADKQIGRFTREILKKYPDSIVVITGDHSSRCYPDNVVVKSEYTAYVPIIFTGAPISEIFKNREIKHAQQLDIIATLVEMLAPKGFEYKAWGSDLLAPKRFAPPITFYAIVNSAGEFYFLDSATCPQQYKEFARKYFGLAYYKSRQFDPVDAESH